MNSEKPHECPECKKRFTQKVSCETHLHTLMKDLMNAKSAEKDSHLSLH